MLKEPEKSRKGRMNLTISETIIREAKQYNINASQEAEKGLAEAVRKAKEKEWLEENKEAIAATNERIKRQGGPLIKAYWLQD